MILDYFHYALLTMKMSSIQGLKRALHFHKPRNQGMLGIIDPLNFEINIIFITFHLFNCHLMELFPYHVFLYIST